VIFRFDFENLDELLLFDSAVDVQYLGFLFSMWIILPSDRCLELVRFSKMSIAQRNIYS
jgi:hypothetical protein